MDQVEPGWQAGWLDGPRPDPESDPLEVPAFTVVEEAAVAGGGDL
jgi:hypothetical protein